VFVRSSEARVTYERWEQVHERHFSLVFDRTLKFNIFLFLIEISSYPARVVPASKLMPKGE
jgi:hypothetical protein